MIKLVRASRVCPNGIKWRICKDTSRCAYILFGQLPIEGTLKWVECGEFDLLADAVAQRHRIMTAKKRKSRQIEDIGEVPF